jgi:hypothetical protein
MINVLSKSLPHESAVSTIFIISVTAVSTSNRQPHPVNSFRMWSYYLLALFPHPVTDNQIEID